MVTLTSLKLSTICLEFQLTKFVAGCWTEHSVFSIFADSATLCSCFRSWDTEEWSKIKPETHKMLFDLIDLCVFPCCKHAMPCFIDRHDTWSRCDMLVALLCRPNSHWGTVKRLSCFTPYLDMLFTIASRDLLYSFGFFDLRKDRSHSHFRVLHCVVHRNRTDWMRACSLLSVCDDSCQWRYDLYVSWCLIMHHACIMTTGVCLLCMLLVYCVLYY